MDNLKDRIRSHSKFYGERIDLLGHPEDCWTMEFLDIKITANKSFGGDDIENLLMDEFIGNSRYLRKFLQYENRIKSLDVLRI